MTTTKYLTETAAKSIIENAGFVRKPHDIHQNVYAYAQPVNDYTGARIGFVIVLVSRENRFHTSAQALANLATASEAIKATAAGTIKSERPKAQRVGFTHMNRWCNEGFSRRYVAA